MSSSYPPPQESRFGIQRHFYRHPVSRQRKNGPIGCRLFRFPAPPRPEIRGVGRQRPSVRVFDLDISHTDNQLRWFTHHPTHLPKGRLSAVRSPSIAILISASRNAIQAVAAFSDFRPTQAPASVTAPWDPGHKSGAMARRRPCV